jgi:hypothetical protein
MCVGLELYQTLLVGVRGFIHLNRGLGLMFHSNYWQVNLSVRKECALCHAFASLSLLLFLLVCFAC